MSFGFELIRGLSQRWMDSIVLLKMDAVIKFISDNKELIGYLGSLASAVLIFGKWFDLRRREIKEKRFQEYMKIVKTISGNNVSSVEQLASVQFLREYKEYDYITRSVFLDSSVTNFSDDGWNRHVYPHILSLLDSESSIKQNKSQ